MTITASRSDRGHTRTSEGFASMAGPRRTQVHWLVSRELFLLLCVGICGSQSNGKILLDHYRDKCRRPAGDERVCHQPVKALRLPTARPKAPAAEPGHRHVSYFPAARAKSCRPKPSASKPHPDEERAICESRGTRVPLPPREKRNSALLSPRPQKSRLQRLSGGRCAEA